MNRSLVKSLLTVVAVIAILKIAATIVGAYFFIPFFMEKMDKAEQRSQENMRQIEMIREQVEKHREKVREQYQRNYEEHRKIEEQLKRK